MLKTKLAALVGTAAMTTSVAFAFAPAANAETVGCAELVERAIAHNQEAIEADIKGDHEAAVQANQDAQGDELGALLACLPKGLGVTVGIVGATLANAQAMTANDRGASGIPAALRAEQRLDATLQRILTAVQ